MIQRQGSLICADDMCFNIPPDLLDEGLPDLLTQKIKELRMQLGEKLVDIRRPKLNDKRLPRSVELKFQRSKITLVINRPPNGSPVFLVAA